MRCQSTKNFARLVASDNAEEAQSVYNIEERLLHIANTSHYLLQKKLLHNLHSSGDLSCSISGRHLVRLKVMVVE